ncbi:gluconate 2-dehydrogenase subunit 3 family protein [Tenacibaculum xiamenense]|uniref:gluconate 2-dehydrogenase subunit 3 family protein n=1 Tax=Tenacibaculum xiamenense TaxID=1261553 RepID=UPI0038937BE5
MKRREAIKRVSLALGSAVVMPSLLNILSSCINDKPEKKYLFLNDEQVSLINKLVNVVLPIDDYPERNQMNLTRFIDEMFYYTEPDKKKEIFNLGSNRFVKSIKAYMNKNMKSNNLESLQMILKNYFNVSKEEEKQIFELLERDFITIDNQLKDKYLINFFLTKVRYYCLLGFCTSEVYLKE